MNPSTQALADSISRGVREAMQGAAEHGVGTEHAALTVERAPLPIAPARLASAHLGHSRAREQARDLYERCLLRYRELADAQGTPGQVDDAGAAVARFVAANLEALHGLHATPEMLKQLEHQLGGVARRSSEWGRASVRDRQFYVEQMAILAVLIGESSAQAVLQGPAALANIRRAARSYLKQLLGLDPDQLTLGPGGLSLRCANQPA
jgi:hypothetical protein